MTVADGGVAPAESWVRCQGRQHQLRWADGSLTTLDHPDADRERMLVALGGDSPRCLEIAGMWDRHATDLDVLLLATRGPGDPLAPSEPEPADGVRYHGGWGAQGYRPLNQLHRHSHFSGGAVGWYGSPDEPDDRPDEVAALLALRDGLPERLVADVLAHWAAAVDEDARSVAAATPALHAALYGRLRQVVQQWLGDTLATLDLRMTASDEPRSVTVSGGPGLGTTVTAELPFRWLYDVWVPGLSTVLGSLCLSATRTAEGGWSLLTVRPDSPEPRTMTVGF